MTTKSKNPRVPSEFADESRGIRLQKAMAATGVASRRECERLIEQGLVTVNGQTVAALPAWVDPARDLIEVEGRPLPRDKSHRSPRNEHVYVLLNKPRRVISTTSDEQGRRSVTDLVDMPPHHPDAPPPRLYPVGRLDAESTGLMLLTNDGELAQRLTHPRYEIAKEYEVSVRGKLDADDVEDLKKGLLLAHRGTKGRRAQTKRARVAEVKLLGHQRDADRGDRTRLLITLHEGQNREIRRMLARLGFKVRRLKRVGIGPLKLKGLAIGQWRKLTGPEVSRLYKEVGLAKGKG